MCLHVSGMPDEWCSICNGTNDAREQERFKYKLHRQTRCKTRLKKRLQILSIAQAERCDYPIEDWEVDYFLDNVPEKDNKYSLLILHELALYFQRTFNAMLWWQRLSQDKEFQQKVFDNPKECHSRAFILRFNNRKNNTTESLLHEQNNIR